MISPHSPSDPPIAGDSDADIRENQDGGDWTRQQQSKVAAVFADMSQLFQAFFRLFERVARDPSLASSVDALANSLIVSGADLCVPGAPTSSLMPLPEVSPIAPETPVGETSPSDANVINPLMCPICWRVFGNPGGLGAHVKYCGKASGGNVPLDSAVPPTIVPGIEGTSYKADVRGRFRIKDGRFSLGRSFAGQQVQVVAVEGRIAVYNAAGELIGVYSQSGQSLPVVTPPPDPNQCPHCGRHFANAGSMKSHAKACLARVQGGEEIGQDPPNKEYTCPHCDRTFKNGGACASHVKSCRKIHAQVPNPPTELHPRNKEPPTVASDQDSLPAALTRQPFQLVVFDVNHLQVSLERKRFYNGDPSVVRRVQQDVLAPLDHAKVPYIAFYYASQNFAHLQRDQPEDPRHRWYVEKSTKRGSGSLAEPVYADVDAALAGQVCGFLERHGGQISRLVLGTGDKDDRVVAARAKQLGIFVEVVVVSDHCLSGELRKLADAVTVLP